MSQPIRISLVFQNAKGAGAGVDAAVKPLDQALSGIAERFYSKFAASFGRIETLLQRIGRVNGLGTGLAKVIGQLDAVKARLEKIEKLNRFGGRSATAQLGADVDSLRARFERLGVSGPRLQQFITGIDASTNTSVTNVSKLNLGLLKLVSTLYLVERASRAAKGWIVDPVVNFTDRVLNATEVYRKFQLSILGVVGSQGRARAISGQLAALSRSGPLTAADAMEGARAASFTPGLAGRFSMGSTQRAARSYYDYAELLGKGAVFDPEQGEKGVGIALRELLSGNAQSLRRRLEINPSALGDAVGKRLTEVLADPAIGLAAFKKFIDTFVGSQSFDLQQGLVENARRKLVDALDQGLSRIGESGVYDSVSDRLRGLTDLLLDSWDPNKNPDFKNQAGRISNSITRIMDNMFGGASAILQRITGDRNPVASLADGTTRLFEAAAKASDVLPHLAEGIGFLIRGIMDRARAIENVFSHGFSTSVKVGGVNIPIEMGNAGELARQREILKMMEEFHAAPAPTRTFPESNYTARGLVSDRLSAQSLERQRALVRDLEGTGSPSSAFDRINSTLSFSELARPYETERNVRGLIDREMSGVSSRVAVQSLVSPLARASGEFEYQAGYSLLLDKQQAIVAQLRDLLREGGEESITYSGELGYPGLLSSAQNDLRVARQARTLPAKINLRNRMPWDMGTGIITAGDMLSGAIGPGKAEVFFSKMIEDKKGAVEAVQALPQRISRELQSIAGAMSSSLKDLPAPVAARLGDSLYDSVAELADNISTELNLPPELRQKLRDSVRTAPDELSRLIDDAIFDAKMKGVPAGLPMVLPTRGDRLLNLSLPTPADQNLDLIKLREDRRDNLLRKYNEISGQAQSSPSDKGLSTSLAMTASDLRENQLELRRLAHDTDQAALAFEQFASSARTSIEDGVGGALYGLITQTESVSDAFRGMAQSVLREWAQMQARMIVQGAVGFLGMPNQGAGGIGMGGLGGFLGGLFGGRNAGTALMAANPTGNFFGASGGSIPFKAFASGGIVSSPTLGLIGEVPGRSEAIVPLLNGSIPVQQVGTQQRDQDRVFIVVDSVEAAWQKGFRVHKDSLVNLIDGRAERVVRKAA